MNNIKGNTSYTSYVYTLIALMPILSLYKFLPILNLGYAMILLCIVFMIIKNKFKVYINIELLFVMSVLMGINLFIGMIKYSDLSNSLNNTISMLLFTILGIFICIPNNLSNDKLYFTCKVVGIIATLFLIYQYVSYKFLGVTIKGNIQFLEPIENAFKSIEYGRPTSFFYEPAHYAIYIAPIYAISLIKKEYIIALIFLAGLIISTSSTGIVFAMIIPITTFLTQGKHNQIRNIILLTIGFIIFSKLIGRYNETFIEKISLANLQNNIRVFGTYSYFKFLSTKELLLGIGLNRLAEVSAYRSFRAQNYTNTYMFSLISFGFFGGGLWIIYNLKLYLNIPIKYMSLVLIMIIISFSDQILFNRNLLYLLIWLYTVKKKKGVNE